MLFPESLCVHLIFTLHSALTKSLHLQFIYHYERLKKASCKSSGMSKGVRAAISDWYSNKRTYDVAFAVTACSSYKRWKHKQLLRMVHIKPGASLGSFIYVHFLQATIIFSFLIAVVVRN